MPSIREKTQLMSASEIDRTMVRLAHEVLEKSPDLQNLAFIGIKRRGVPMAQRLAKNIESLEGYKVPVGVLDINLYRDDLSTVGPAPRRQRHADRLFGGRQRRTPDGRRALHRPHDPRRAGRVV